MKTIDLNEFYAQWCKDPRKTKLEMVNIAAREILEAVQEDYYNLDDLKNLNFAEICEWCHWPNFQDSGIFEQVIEIAANTVLEVLGYKAQH